MNLEKDHVKPVYQGGSDAIENIQPSCARCNARKGPDSTDKRYAAMSSWVERFEHSVGRKLLKTKDGAVCLDGSELSSPLHSTPQERAPIGLSLLKEETITGSDAARERLEGAARDNIVRLARLKGVNHGDD